MTTPDASSHSENHGCPTVRPAVEADAQAVASLFERHLKGNVADPERDGFVQGRFSAELALGYIAQRGLIVADLDGVVVGVAAAAEHVPGGGPGPSQEITRRAAELLVDGRPLNARRWIMYGPLVIDRQVRGQGLARQLFTAVIGAWSGRAEVAVAFVDTANTRSMGVHRNGFGMTTIATFPLEEHLYAVLAVSVPDGTK